MHAQLRNFGLLALLSNMATAGALAGMDNAAAYSGQIGEASQSMMRLDTQLMGNLKTQLTSTLMDSAIQGKTLSTDSLSAAFKSAFINTGLAKGANQIGDARADKTLNDFTQALSHAVLGCVGGAAIQGGGCSAGAVGGVVGELTAKYATEQGGLSKDTSLKLAKIVSAASGLLIDPNSASAVNIANTTGTNAAVNNFLFSKNKNELKKVAAACENQNNAASCQRQKILENRDKELDEIQAAYKTEKDKPVMKEMIGEVAKLYQGEFDKYGVNAESFLTTMANIESTFKPDVTNSSGFQGLYQFSKSLAMDAKDGYNIGNISPEIRKDPVWSTAAAAQMALDNAKELQKNGIEVTPENLYFAHQQGSLGAKALLKNPNMSAVDALLTLPGYQRKGIDFAKDAIIKNGGFQNIGAKEFVEKWKNKYIKNQEIK
jgi:hypothetical protein